MGWIGRAIMDGSRLMAVVGLAGLSVSAHAEPSTAGWPGAGAEHVQIVAAARVAGLYAFAPAGGTTVTVHDIRQTPVRVLETAEIQAASAPFRLREDSFGIRGLAYSDSGRLLFLVVGSDDNGAVLRYDRLADRITPFARLRLPGQAGRRKPLPAAHFAGRLYVGCGNLGVAVLDAGANQTNGHCLGFVTLPDRAPATGIAVDAEGRRLFLSSPTALYRAVLDTATIPAIERMGSLSDIQGVAHSSHFGSPSDAGLYILSPAQLWRIPPEQCAGEASFRASAYLDDMRLGSTLAATPCGRLLVGSDRGAILVTDDRDPRLPFRGWLTNEILQTVAFAESLVTRSPLPPGWVVDADVQRGGARFHPASPDAALWAIALLVGADRISDYPSATGTVRTILARYAGRASDGIVPKWSADGIHGHWIDPLNGGTKPGGWSDELATMSTMKLVKGAAIAVTAYPSDPDIRLSAEKIIGGVRNWTDYFEPDTDAMYLVARPEGGPQRSSGCRPFHEGLLFVEQAATYGRGGEALYARWLDRARWPAASYLAGFPVTGNVVDHHQSAFLTLYANLLIPAFRQSRAWQAQVRNLYYSMAAWTDDHGPRWFTVFSAGTTPSGYNADSLDHHPGDITTLPALMAFCATGDWAPAVAAYHAYRTGARQTFSGGATILYRRSNATPAYQPNSAGLPDVAMGALGLMEVLRPGTLDSLWARPLPPWPLSGAALPGGETASRQRSRSFPGDGFMVPREDGRGAGLPGR